ncbi:MAG: cyanophycinase [Gemmatimonadota bacterium]|nr:cyanophycinase [Gemmatimonadota bacterium]
MAAAKKSGRTGHLLVIGGAEDKDENTMRILPHLVEMAGGKEARILVCSTPSASPEEKGRIYRHLFEKIGVAEVLEAPISERHEAETPEMVEAAARATAVFFTGGDQLRLTALIAGTVFFDTIRERAYTDGLVLAGTSAGAAAMSATMVIGGPNDGTVRRADVQLAPGLGFWRDVVVDTHFNARGRVSRLMTIFAHNPQVLGIGLDENTAVDVIPGDRFRVVGTGCVMVFDGRVTHSSAPDAADDETLAITDSALHVLPEGYGFDLKTMRPLRPDGEEIPKKR